MSSRRDRDRDQYPAAGPPPKYLNDFSKALASEVRVLLEEVGKLRDERRQLQFEIAELMSVKSKHGAGGEYSPNWRPTQEQGPPPPEAVPPPPPPADDTPVSARPGWRSVPKRTEKRHGRGQRGGVTPAAASPPPPAAPKPLPAWAQWRPNPLLVPNMPPPAQAAAPPPPPPRVGLFGPPSPGPQ